ncbi:MAG TPA: ABC-F family ATP-binding cassette domain-containing protein [Firmicutes bacterium]|nr:ABC-F family ATP-binding cassette domain-containing protein [Bacillota bacterium]
MVLLNAEHLVKNYTEKPLLQDVSLAVETGEKVGIIGVNGTGKSTLLKILAGAEEPEAGRITRAAGLRTGYLPQNPDFDPAFTVLEQALSMIPAGEREEKAYLCKSLLTRLQAGDYDAPVGQLSGGQRRRVALAGALALHPDLLILDEPTNHIDAGLAAWLEDYLRDYTGAILMVTHDRYFLDRVATRILELERGALTAYPAGYDNYLERKAQLQEMEAATARKRQALLKRELEWMHRGARARGTKSKYRLERVDELQAESGPIEGQRVEMAAPSARLGKKIVEVEGISKSYGEKRLFADFSYNLLRDDRIGIIGPNGCGKSTFLKILMGEEQPDSGQITTGATVRLGYFSQEWEKMDPAQRPVDYIKSIASEVDTGKERLSAVQMMENFLFDTNLQYTTIGRLSGGERRRLYLLGVLMSAPNILLLDEPTNDLDIQTLTVLEDYLESFPGAVLAVSHDRYFLDKVARHLFIFDDGKITDSLGGYTAYADTLQQAAAAEKKEKPAEKKPRREKGRLRFSYNEQREFSTIDQDIADLEAQLSALEKEIEAKASDYGSLPGLLQQKEALEKTLSEKMDRWVYLNDLAERIAAQSQD